MVLGDSQARSVGETYPGLFSDNYLSYHASIPRVGRRVAAFQALVVVEGQLLLLRLLLGLLQEGFTVLLVLLLLLLLVEVKLVLQVWIGQAAHIVI